MVASEDAEANGTWLWKTGMAHHQPYAQASASVSTTVPPAGVSTGAVIGASAQEQVFNRYIRQLLRPKQTELYRRSVQIQHAISWSLGVYKSGNWNDSDLEGTTPDITGARS